MATQTKLTIKRGQRAQDLTIAAGTAITGSDAIEINIDQTNMTRNEALVLLDETRRRILEGKWPLPTS